MKTISSNDLKKILRKHILWLRGDPDGERADLSEANLYGANLRGADLSEADLYKANLSRANLSRANLSRANLSRANLSRANLREVYLGEANLRGADLYGANLRGANLRGADLGGAKLDWPLACQEKGSFIGYKKCRNNLIVELEIPEDAYRCSATSKKCRCSKAKVLYITNLDGSESTSNVAVSKYDSSFVYRIGETVEVTDFDQNRWNECSTGIHFFMNREDAVKYVY